MTWYLPIYEVIVHSAAASLVVLLVATIGLLIVRQPVRRGRLILTTLLACLMVPTFSFVPGLPHWSVEWTSEPVSVSGETVVSPNSERLVLESTNLPPLEIETSDSLPLELATINSGPEVEKSELVAFVETVPATTPFDFRPAVVVCYLTGAGAMALWWFVGVIGLWRLQRRSISAPTEVRAVLRSIGGTDTDRVRLLTSHRVPQPFTFTWRRPVIVLPAELCESPDSDALRWCLAHEWAHVEDRHARAWLIASVVRVLFFYQPLVWWLRGQLRLSQDYLADNRAACQAAEPEDYAEFLTTIMANGLTRFAGSGLAMAARKSELYRRVVMITKTTAPLPRTCGRRWTWFTGVVGVAVVVAIASYRLTPEVVEANEPEIASPADEETAAAIRVAEGKVLESDEADAKKTDDKTTKKKDSFEFEGSVTVNFSKNDDAILFEGDQAAIARLIRMLDKKDAEKDETINKEDLTYQGKTFQQWRRELRTELDVKSQKEAIKALSIFGRGGLGAEATETLVRLFDDPELQGAASAALARLETVAMPSLIKALKSNDVNVRKYACYSLRMGPAGKDAIPYLENLLQDENRFVQMAACSAISSIGVYDKSTEEKLVKLFNSEAAPFAIWALAGIYDPDATTTKALIKATKKHPRIAGMVLAQIGPVTKEVSDAVASTAVLPPSTEKNEKIDGLQFSDRERDHIFSSYPPFGFGPKYRPRAEIMGPASIRVIELANDSVRGFGGLNSVHYDNQAGRNAVKWLQDHPSALRSAVPAMTGLLFRTKDYQLQSSILATLQSLGPKAKEAIPALRAALAKYDRLKALADQKPEKSRERRELLVPLRNTPSGDDIAQVLKAIEGKKK